MYQTNMPLYTNTGLNTNTNSVNPVTKFSVEQYPNQYGNQFQATPQKQPYADPYTDYVDVIRSCSKLVQEQIYNDPSYIKAEDGWENLKRQALNEILVPQLLQTNQGYQKCEALYQTTLKCKEFYEAQEVESQQRLLQTQQQLQNFYDSPEALKKRLQEIEGTKQVQQTAVTTQNVVEENVQKPQNYNNKNKNNGGVK